MWFLQSCGVVSQFASEVETNFASVDDRRDVQVFIQDGDGSLREMFDEGRTA